MKNIIKRPKVIWFLTPVNTNLLLGGCLGRLKKWSNHFDTEMFDIEIILGVRDEKQFDELKKQFDLNGKVKIKPVFGINPTWKISVFGWYSLWRAVRAEKPIIIHSFMLQSDILAAIFKPKYTKLISSWEGKLFEDHRWSRLKLKIYKIIYNLIVHRIDRIIALCGFTKKQNMETTATNNGMISIVYSGLDIDSYRYSYKNRNVVINVGYMARLEEGKCPFLFLLLVKKLNFIFPNIKFYLGGDGPDRQKIAQFIVDEGLSHCVNMVGYVNNVRDFFCDLDLFIFLSKREGLPWTILEALAMGIPTIASSVGGVSEIIHNQENGILLETDSIHELLNASLTLIDNFEVRKKISLNASATIKEKFESQKEVNKITSIYNECQLSH